MTILEKIFQTKRDEVERSKSILSPAELRAFAKDSPRRLGFLQALRNAPLKPALIAEVKQASPSQGQIYNGEFNPVEIAKTYEASGAECLSVLTDEPYFKGSPEYLRAVRREVHIPLLRKDFIFDEYQIDEALVWGADCILLIVAGLEVERLRSLFDAAKERGVDVLVEVHNEPETEIALGLSPDLIGINNRDLSTFETDIETTRRLINLIPDHIFKVSESALHAHDDVARVAGYGADAVLIGTAFCGSPDIGAKVREVMGR
ncbi:MAG: indole-3-glycerol phosphate synthase TrpC [Armatimonadetes bacterium]|nr:indole-3-glycerol phosphate synthase TrpC [Armatimonadota bacterium]